MLAEIFIAVEVAIKALEVVTVVLQTWAVLERFLKPEENAEKMGAKMLAADSRGVERDSFDSYQDYIESVRNLEIDDEELDKFSKEDRMKKFITSFDDFLKEKYDDSPIELLLREIIKNPEMEKILLDENRIKIWFEVFKNLGLQTEKIEKYLNNELPVQEAVKVKNALKEAEKQKEPQKSDEEIENFFDELENIRS